MAMSCNQGATQSLVLVMDRAFEYVREAVLRVRARVLRVEGDVEPIEMWVASGVSNNRLK